jgi:hypothetical protein
MRIPKNAVLTLLFAALGAVSAPAQSFILDQLGPAGPTGFVSAFGSPGFALLGGPDANAIHMNGPGTTVGNVGISAGTLSLDSSNPVGIQGNVYLATGVTIDSGSRLVSGTVFTDQNSLLTSAFNSAVSASSAFASLAPTNTTITSITGPETISSAPGSNVRNVLDLSTINLGQDQVLTLSGNASDQFILNLSGELRLNAGKILLSGGLTPQDVVINLGSGSSVSTSHGLNDESVITGILLGTSPNSSLQFSPGLVNGEVITDATHVQFASGASVVSPVPEGNSLGLVAAVGIAVFGRCAMRRRWHA